MGMADPRIQRAARLTILLAPTDDREITCCACGHVDCEFEFSSRAAGRRSFIGIHADCADKTGALEVT
jgi:hypothetical protein